MSTPTSIINDLPSITNQLKRLNKSLTTVAETDLLSIATPKSDYLGLRLHQSYRKVHWKSIATPTAKPTLIVLGPKDMGVRLPQASAKLRIKIYAEIINSIPAADAPTDTSTPSAITLHQIFVDKRVAASYDLEEYRGLILSNKTVYKEFENEWLRAFGPWLHDNFNFPRLILPTVTKITDTAHLCIGLQDQPGGWLHNPTDIQPEVALLVDNLPSFCLYPVTTYLPDLGPLTEYQISRVKLGRKGRNQSRFLHAMKLLAVAVYQADFHAIEHHPDVGENYQVVAMNWAWKEVVMGREGMARWVGVDWRGRVFYSS